MINANTDYTNDETVVKIVECTCENFAEIYAKLVRDSFRAAGLYACVYANGPHNDASNGYHVWFGQTAETAEERIVFIVRN